MKIIFIGDRKSKAIKLARMLRKTFGKNIIGIDLWDGYPSRISIEWSKLYSVKDN